jgi:iron complex transport system substrate-binding protein
MRKIVYATTLMVFLMALCLALTFMPAAAQDENATGTITVTDDRGKSMEIPYPCERIVFLVENAMNTMYAVGGADNIVGIGGIYMEEEKAPFFRAIDPNFDEKVRISGGTDAASMEALAQADPDLVILWSTDVDDERTVAIEENLGVPTFGVFIDDLNDTLAQAEVFSRIIGKEERGQEVQDDMSRYISKVTDVTAPIPDEERPKVYWMWTDVLGTAGTESTANDLIYLAGGINLMQVWDDEAASMEHPKLNLETLVELNPDVIYMWYNPSLDPEDVLTGSEFEGWKDISAVKNERVYEITDPFVFDFHSPRLPLALMLLAKDIQPEKFQDLDLDQEIDDLFVDIYSVHYPGYAPA